MCLALVFAIQKLRHYMHVYTIHLVTKADPVKYVMSKPVLAGRLAKWALLLNQYEIIYVPAKAFKGQALANFLAEHPISADWKSHMTCLTRRYSTSISSRHGQCFSMDPHEMTERGQE
ncbi:hypothetical protein ACFX2F_020337 [Malus domestica]